MACSGIPFHRRCYRPNKSVRELVAKKHGIETPLPNRVEKLFIDPNTTRWVGNEPKSRLHNRAPDPVSLEANEAHVILDTSCRYQR